MAHTSMLLFLDFPEPYSLKGMSTVRSVPLNEGRARMVLVMLYKLCIMLSQNYFAEKTRPGLAAMSIGSPT